MIRLSYTAWFLRLLLPFLKEINLFRRSEITDPYVSRNPFLFRGEQDLKPLLGNPLLGQGMAPLSSEATRITIERYLFKTFFQAQKCCLVDSGLSRSPGIFRVSPRTIDIISMLTRSEDWGEPYREQEGFSALVAEAQAVLNFLSRVNPHNGWVQDPSEVKREYSVLFFRLVEALALVMPLECEDESLEPLSNSEPAHTQSVEPELREFAEKVWEACGNVATAVILSNHAPSFFDRKLYVVLSDQADSESLSMVLSELQRITQSSSDRIFWNRFLTYPVPLLVPQCALRYVTRTSRSSLEGVFLRQFAGLLAGTLLSNHFPSTVPSMEALNLERANLKPRVRRVLSHRALYTDERAACMLADMVLGTFPAHRLYWEKGLVSLTLPQACSEYCNNFDDPFGELLDQLVLMIDFSRGTISDSRSFMERCLQGFSTIASYSAYGPGGADSR